jgi:hypothetical protein
MVRKNYYQFACPQCGAEAGKACYSTGGFSRPPHFQRRRRKVVVRVGYDYDGVWRVYRLDNDEDLIRMDGPETEEMEAAIRKVAESLEHAVNLVVT